MVTQSQGETDYDAFINDNSLDIEQEQDFLDWLASKDFITSEMTAQNLQAVYEI